MENQNALKIVLNREWCWYLPLLLLVAGVVLGLILVVHAALVTFGFLSERIVEFKGTVPVYVRVGSGSGDAYSNLKKYGGVPVSESQYREKTKAKTDSEWRLCLISPLEDATGVVVPFFACGKNNETEPEVGAKSQTPKEAVQAVVTYISAIRNAR